MTKFVSVEAEQGLLGAVLLNNDAFHAVQGIVEPGHFFEGVHRQIFEVMTQLIGAGKLANPIILQNFLPMDVPLAKGVTIGQYVARLAAEATTIVNAPDFARVVRDLADRRHVLAVGEELQRSVNADAGALASWGVEQLDSVVISSSGTASPAVTMQQAVTRAVEATATAYQNEGKLRGLSSGLADLDAKTLGAKPGELIVIGGRPGMGKSGLALGLARNMGGAGHPGIFFSHEMGDVDLVSRMISDELYDTKKLSYFQIQSGKYKEDRFDDIIDASKRLAELPIKIEQETDLTAAQIVTRARQYKRRHGLAWIMVDHLGLVKPSSLYAGNKVNETGEITRTLKSAAKELGIPLFLLAQINRGVEQRDDKRPTLSDLRNSGDIEQDADTVLLLYRPGYYLAKKEPPAGSVEFQMWNQEMEQVFNHLDIGVEKQRAGPTGIVRVHVDIAHNAIRNQVAEMDDRYALSKQDALDFK